MFDLIIYWLPATGRSWSFSVLLKNWTETFLVWILAYKTEQGAFEQGREDPAAPSVTVCANMELEKSPDEGGR